MGMQGKLIAYKKGHEWNQYRGLNCGYNPNLTFVENLPVIEDEIDYILLVDCATRDQCHELCEALGTDVAGIPGEDNGDYSDIEVLGEKVDWEKLSRLEWTDPLLSHTLKLSWHKGFTIEWCPSY